MGTGGLLGQLRAAARGSGAAQIADDTATPAASGAQQAPDISRPDAADRHHGEGVARRRPRRSRRPPARGGCVRLGAGRADRRRHRGRSRFPAAGRGARPGRAVVSALRPTTACGPTTSRTARHRQVALADVDARRPARPAPARPQEHVDPVVDERPRPGRRSTAATSRTRSRAAGGVGVLLPHLHGGHTAVDGRRGPVSTTPRAPHAAAVGDEQQAEVEPLGGHAARSAVMSVAPVERRPTGRGRRPRSSPARPPPAPPARRRRCTPRHGGDGRVEAGPRPARRRPPRRHRARNRRRSSGSGARRRCSRRAVRTPSVTRSTGPGDGDHAAEARRRAPVRRPRRPDTVAVESTPRPPRPCPASASTSDGFPRTTVGPAASSSCGQRGCAPGACRWRPGPAPTACPLRRPPPPPRASPRCWCGAGVPRFTSTPDASAAMRARLVRRCRPSPVRAPAPAARWR